MNRPANARCWVEVERAALRHNAQVARRRAGGRADVLAVIKANAYGHGLSAVAETLATDAQLFGVANLQEAIEARQAAELPIIILGPALPEERAEIVARGFIPSISSAAEARAFAGAGRVRVNCAIDTGMGRMGLGERAAMQEMAAIAATPGLEIHSISTHLPSADEDVEYTRAQLAHFRELVERIRQAVPGSYRFHALPSAGVLSLGEESAFDIVRAGLMLYGVSPLPRYQEELRPALTWKTRVVLVRDLPAGSTVSYGRTWKAPRPTRVATLSVGYADGYPRLLSNRGTSVLLAGRRCPLLGRVTMDLCMIDVTEAGEVSLGAEAVLLGRQGTEEIPAGELAEKAMTIPWEIFTSIGSRVARVYV